MSALPFEIFQRHSRRAGVYIPGDTTVISVIARVKCYSESITAVMKTILTSGRYTS